MPEGKDLPLCYKFGETARLFLNFTAGILASTVKSCFLVFWKERSTVYKQKVMSFLNSWTGNQIFGFVKKEHKCGTNYHSTWASFRNLLPLLGKTERVRTKILSLRENER